MNIFRPTLGQISASLTSNFSHFCLKISQNLGWHSQKGDLCTKAVVISNAGSFAFQSPTSFSTLWLTLLTVAGIGAEILGGYLAYLQRTFKAHSIQSTT